MENETVYSDEDENSLDSFSSGKSNYRFIALNIYEKPINAPKEKKINYSEIKMEKSRR